MRNPLEDDRYAIIPIPPGPPPSNAVMIGGPLSSVLEYIPDTRARHDSIRAHQAARIDAMASEQKQKASRALQVKSFCDRSTKYPHVSMLWRNGVRDVRGKLPLKKTLRSKKRSKII